MTICNKTQKTSTQEMNRGLYIILFSNYFLTGFDKSFFEYRSSSPLFIAGYIVWMYNSPVYYVLLILKLSLRRSS